MLSLLFYIYIICRTFVAVDSFIVVKPSFFVGRHNLVVITRVPSSSSSLLLFSSSSIPAIEAPISKTLASKYYQLEEMEDREAFTTEIFLHNDGTISIKQTNGPLPITSSGTWTVVEGDNKNTFKMNILRTFQTGHDLSDVGEFQFDVERSFEGELLSIGGRIGVEGSMHMKDEIIGNANIGFFSMIDTTNMSD